MNPQRGIPEDITEAYCRGLMHSVDYRRKDQDKPKIAVRRSCSTARSIRRGM